MHDICDSTIVLQVLVLEATGVLLLLLEIQLVFKLYKLQQDKTKTLKKLENTSLKPQGLLLIGPKTAKTPRRCASGVVVLRYHNTTRRRACSIFVFDWALIGDESSFSVRGSALAGSRHLSFHFCLLFHESLRTCDFEIFFRFGVCVSETHYQSLARSTCV